MPVTRQDEKPEYPFMGPFGGIQAEVGVSQIGNTGFAETQNLITYRARMRTVPAFTSLSSPSTEAIVGIADFYNVNGVRNAVVFTPTKMYKWNGSTQTWTQITPGSFSALPSQFMQWAVVGYNLFFSQQKSINFWDGVSAGFTSVNIVAAKYLMELGFHLVIANTIEAGPTNAPNRVRWSAVGDGTNWTDFTSGQTDIFNNLGPITGLCRLFQSGFIFQQWGITRVDPTGIGLQPFQFTSMGAYAKGNILPYSLASFGELVAAYVGKDDIYIFDGTSSQPIGSRPLEGNVRIGARARIFNDLLYAVQSNVFGFILTSANGNTYESYWLFIPSLNKAWVYNFDEGNWSQVLFNNNQLWGPVGVFPVQQIPRIMDLVGLISGQQWSPATLTNATTFDTLAVSDLNSFSISYLNFGSAPSLPTTGSINVNDGWYIRSGALDFDDNRHTHTVARVRLVIEDLGAVTYNLRLTNEFGFQTSQSITLGTGSGAPITSIIPLSPVISGKYITWELSGPQGKNVNILEVTPYYDVGGEVQQGR